MKMKINQELLLEAAAQWQGMADFRSRRDRCKRYCYGRQWDDLIEVDGRMMKEEEYIRREGNVPLKNNLIRRMVRSVLGVFRNRYAYPARAALHIADDAEGKALYNRLKENADLNRMAELHARTMEEFLISGLAVHRKQTGAGMRRISGTVRTEMLRTDYVAPDSFFMDTAARDFRGWDVTMVGQTHDLDFRTLCAALARSEEDVQALRGIYLPLGNAGTPAGNADFGSVKDAASRSFLCPASPGMCRVIEVWTRLPVQRYRVHDRSAGKVYRISAEDKKFLEKRAGDRLVFSRIVEEEWSYHYLAPTGHVLTEGVSPLKGGGHPYVWKAYPFIDGEIHSFVSDVIDQQRHTNRLITLYDWVIRSSAKGVLLFPESALPEDVEIDDISDEWSRFNGVILFRPKAGMPLPQQVSGNASQAGITELLNIQLKMFEDVSGVNGALEGKLTNNNVSGTLYNQQTRQAMTALLDILESYDTFVREGAELDKRLLG